jgi:hypothetical protein
MVKMFQDHHATFFFILSLSFVGIFTSFFSGTSVSEIFNLLLSNVAQQFLILTVTYVICVKIGFKFTAWAFLSLTLFTGTVGVLQALDVQPAWTLFETLAQIQSVPTEFINRASTADRPKGVSLTPILLSYHLVVGYLVANLMYRYGVISSKTYYILFIAIFLMVVANATRSAILGIIIHELFFRVVSLNKKSLFWILILSLLCVGIFLFLQSIGSRIVQFDDASAVGRFALYKFGMLIAIDHPFGLGWGFDANELAWRYWEHIAGAEKSNAIFRIELHNAFLNFIITYGVLGLVLSFMFFVFRFGETLLIIISSIAYLVHAFFHNDFAFLGEVYYFFFLALILYILNNSRTESD